MASRRLLDVMQYKGIVVQAASKYYRMLPSHWVASISFEDFIQIGLLALVERLKHYDKKRGAPSTLAYVTVHNTYKGFLEKISYKKRTKEVVSLDAETPWRDQAMEISDELSQASITLAAEAEVSVRKLHRACSFGLLCFLDDTFFHMERRTTPKLHSPKFYAIKSEFQVLAEQYGVTIDAYRVAITMHHARRQLTD